MATVGSRVIGRTYIHGLDQLLRGRDARPGSGDLSAEGLRVPRSGGLLVLVKGAPGTGKSTLAAQLALAATTWASSPQDAQTGGDTGKVYYLTLEQEPKEIVGLHRRLRAGLKKAARDSQPTCGRAARDLHEALAPERPVACQSPRKLVHAPAQVMSQASLLLLRARDAAVWLSEGAKPKREPKPKLASYRHRLIVIDGLNALAAEEKELAEIEELGRLLRQHCEVGVILCSTGDDPPSSLDYQCDLVISLQWRVTPDPHRYHFQFLRIEKSRYQEAALGWHQYKIREHGLQVFPSVHFRISDFDPFRDRLRQAFKPLPDIRDSSNPPRRKLHTGATGQDCSLLARMIGPDAMLAGSSTVVLGGRRTCKTQLTFDFLVTGSVKHKHEHGLLVSAIDNTETIMAERGGLCCQADCPFIHSPWRQGGGEKASCPQDRTSSCCQHVSLLHLVPGYISLAEFIDALERRLLWAETRGEPVSRLVFWDLTQLSSRLPLLAEDPMFLTGLIEYLKHSTRGVAQRTGTAGHRAGGRAAGRAPTNERAVSSVFMGGTKSRLSREAAVLADNVLYATRTYIEVELTGMAKQSHYGVAVWVDRVEGEPGRGKLWFVPDRDSGRQWARLDPKTLARVEPGGERPCPVEISEELRRGQLRHIGQWVDRISGMQGFLETSPGRGDTEAPR